MPDAATRPLSRITTRSQTRSTSPIRWEFEQHGDAARLQREHEVADVDPAERVQRAGRLVEDDELRPGDQRDGEARAAAACPSRTRRPGRPRGRRGRRGPGTRAARRRRRRRRASRTCRSSTSAGGQPRLVAEELGQVPDGAAGPRVGRPPAEQQHLAGVGPDQAEQHLDDAGLPGAVGAEQAEHLAAGDREARRRRRRSGVRTACAARSTRPPGTAADSASTSAAEPAAAVSEVMPRTLVASAEATGDRQHLVGAQRAGDAGHRRRPRPRPRRRRARRGRSSTVAARPSTSAVELVTSSAGTGSGSVAPSAAKVAQLLGRARRAGRAGTAGSRARSRTATPDGVDRRRDRRGRRRASARRWAATRRPRRRDRPRAGARLPSSPAGGGGRTSPSAAAACAAFSAEKVNVALTAPATWYVGSPVTPSGSVGRPRGRRGRSAPRAVAASATCSRSPAPASISRSP